MKENFKKAIKIINRLLNKNRIKWALVGSTNMQLQGVNINPRDLDIVVSISDLKKIPEIFSGYNVSNIRKLPPMTNEPAWEVKITLEDVEVQILGERNTGEYVSKLLLNNLIKIKVGNIKIPCFTLEAEAQTYVETGRKYKADLIHEFLKNGLK